MIKWLILISFCFLSFIKEGAIILIYWLSIWDTCLSICQFKQGAIWISKSAKQIRIFCSTQVLLVPRVGYDVCRLTCFGVCYSSSALWNLSLKSQLWASFYKGGEAYLIKYNGRVLSSSVITTRHLWGSTCISRREFHGVSTTCSSTQTSTCA
jgi:hypothetical protein